VPIDDNFRPDAFRDDPHPAVNGGRLIVLFTIVDTSVTGGHLSVLAGVLEFAEVVGMGLSVGFAIGFAASHVIRRVDDPMIEITLTTIAAYGSFVAAEAFHFRA